MSNKPIQLQTQTDNDVYMKIWEGEQDYQRHRWTIVTFFIGISFAILGLSFQTRIPSLSLLAMRLIGISIYWFAYSLYVYFYGYTKALRTYLTEMENAGKVHFNLQSRIVALQRDSFLHKIMSAKKFLLFFGVLYTLLVALIWMLGF